MFEMATAFFLTFSVTIFLAHAIEANLPSSTEQERY